MTPTPDTLTDRLHAAERALLWTTPDLKANVLIRSEALRVKRLIRLAESPVPSAIACSLVVLIGVATYLYLAP